MLARVISISPPSVAFQVGPVAVPWYGLGYSAALAVGVWLAYKQARFKGEEPGHIENGIILVGVLGVIAARLYHVIDQWNAIYSHDPIRAILPPYTGLAIYGGILGGTIGVFWYTRRHHLSFLRWADICVPSVFFGQAIARWGNFFNQELYGPPTRLPWGIAIDCAHRVPEYPCSLYPFATTGFQPLFFYESMLTLAGGIIALWASRRLAGWLRDGDLLSFWLIWYGAVRAVLETFRHGYDWTFLGVPVAILISFGVIALGLGSAVWRHRRPAAVADRAPDGAAGVEEEGSA